MLGRTRDAGHNVTIYPENASCRRQPNALYLQSHHFFSSHNYYPNVGNFFRGYADKAGALADKTIKYILAKHVSFLGDISQQHIYFSFRFMQWMPSCIFMTSVTNDLIPDPEILWTVCCVALPGRATLVQETDIHSQEKWKHWSFSQLQ